VLKQDYTFRGAQLTGKKREIGIRKRDKELYGSFKKILPPFNSPHPPSLANSDNTKSKEINFGSPFLSDKERNVEASWISSSSRSGSTSTSCSSISSSSSGGINKRKRLAGRSLNSEAPALSNVRAQ
jgi:hypothetical protein